MTALWWWLIDRPVVGRLMCHLGRHDPWCRGRLDHYAEDAVVTDARRQGQEAGR